jgi:hypothetical protein
MTTLALSSVCALAQRAPTKEQPCHTILIPVNCSPSSVGHR